MKWFRHDSSAHRDIKLKRLKRKYGITGYGLYWYCLELIADHVEKNNITFELEDDAEEIAHEWSLDRVTVSEIMMFMVDQGLFESSGNRITCMKMALRLDDTNSRNPEMQKLIAKLNAEKRQETSGISEHSSGISEVASGISEDPSDRLDKTRLDKKELLTSQPQAVATPNPAKMTKADHEMVIALYHDMLPELTSVLVERWHGSKHAKALQARWSESPKYRSADFWHAFFETVRLNDWWMGQRAGSDGEPWKGCKLAWLVVRSNFDKVLEAGS